MRPICAVHADPPGRTGHGWSPDWCGHMTAEDKRPAETLRFGAMSCLVHELRELPVGDRELGNAESAQSDLPHRTLAIGGGNPGGPACPLGEGGRPGGPRGERNTP